MNDATLTPDAGAPSPPLPALLPPRALDAALAEKTTDQPAGLARRMGRLPRGSGAWRMRQPCGRS
jgi:hypothetical protein